MSMCVLKQVCKPYQQKFPVWITEACLQTFKPEASGKCVPYNREVPKPGSRFLLFAQFILKLENEDSDCLFFQSYLLLIFDVKKSLQLYPQQEKDQQKKAIYVKPFPSSSHLQVSGQFSNRVLIIQLGISSQIGW